MSAEEKKFPHTNRLIHEKSPYLLQHAHNPVDWYPFGEEAFLRAKKENKPIFISIGYSTCHWCHVMERESFENEATAKLMNEDFVCVKVDREERPDVDQIYMSAVMALTGQGGWPLNLFLTPDLKPFYGGTYFAPDGRYGRPGFPTVLTDVARIWKTQPDQAQKAGQQLAEYVSQSASKISEASPTELDESVLKQTVESFARVFDSQDGGFGGAPKFPSTMAIRFLLRYHQKTGDSRLLPMVEKTLDKMAQGGIYDQLGGGFARYSTDDRWLVPHFEKMLYDNALLARTYLEAFQVTGAQEYARIAQEIFSYLFRDMTDKDGGFYSAEDADSEGEEGKFYLFTPDELKAALGEKDGEDFGRLYEATEKGNFEGSNILHLNGPLSESLKSIGRDQAWWSLTREKLLQVRSKRIRPHLDDKILTGWNSLMISSLATAYQILGNREYLQAAQKASDFISRNLQKNGRLLASYRQGPAEIEGFIDDYAFFQQAQLDLYESTFDPAYLREALNLYEGMNKLFWDEAQGGFYFTGSDQKDQARLLARPKEAYDGAQPSGNSVAALNFYRLAEFTGQKEIRQRADVILKTFSPLLSRSGPNFTQMLQAFQYDFYGPSEIFVVGPRKDSEEALRLVWKTYLPHRALVFSEDSGVPDLVSLVPWVEGRLAQEGKPTVYVCENFQCQWPTSDLQKVRELLVPREK